MIKLDVSRKHADSAADSIERVMSGGDVPPASMDVYGERIKSTVDVYESSLRSWRGRRKVYTELLEQWEQFGQLRRNPIDDQRLAFVDGEIQKQTDKLAACKANLSKFEELQRQMKELADEVPLPNAAERETAAADEDAFMEIREGLDDEDNVISSSITPQSSKKLAGIESVLSESEKGGQASSSNVEPDITPPTKLDVVDGATADPGVRHDRPVTFSMVTNKDGEQELVDDPEGFSVSVIPPDVLEMNDIANEIDWDEVDAELARSDDDELSEDEYGRSRAGFIPKPAILERTTSTAKTDEEDRPLSARSKKKLVFAEDLVKGPTPGGTPTRGVLKKTTSYPLPAEGGEEPIVTTPEVVKIEAPKPKASRFKMARSSTDQKIATRHAQPSKAYKQKLGSNPVQDKVVERDLDDPDDDNQPPPQPKRPDPPARTPSADLTTEERQRLYPKKTNLASVDLAEDAGVTKKAFTAPTLSPEALEAIRKKREALGKKGHRRRKSADPQTPVRSSSFDEHGPPAPHHSRSKSSAGLDEEEQSDKIKEIREARLQRAKELLKAQDDIAWANQPLTPPSPDKKAKDPLAAEGKAIAAEVGGAAQFLSSQPPSEVKALLPTDPSRPRTEVATTAVPKQSTIAPILSTGNGGLTNGTGTGTRTPPIAHGPPIVSPRATKAPTPERRYSTDRPSPLSNEIKPDQAEKQVQFSQQVVERLAPLSEDVSSASALPTVVRNLKQPRKLAPPREPRRKASIDPIVISPTPGSPPPENRKREPIATEQHGAVHHTMVRATPKSPPPHIAIHDLVSDNTPEHVRLAMKREAEGTSPTPVFDTGGGEVEPVPQRANGKKGMS